MKILIVAGASGGHIFPALAFIDHLSSKSGDVDALLVLPKLNTIPQAQIAKYKVSYVSLTSIRRRFDFKGIFSIFNFLKGSAESLFILISFRPDIVVGFGTLICLPMIFFSWIFRIKILIHEQNVIPGSANRVLAWFSDCVAVSFEKTRNYFQRQSDKVVLTGNPIRSGLIKIEKTAALGFFGFKPGKLTLLVMGGSQASHRINLSLLKAVSSLPDRRRLQIIHLGGAQDFRLLEDGYRDLHVDISLFTFFASMQYAYSACDLAISRSGATTIAELVYFSLPAILIPYPYALEHQAANAEVLSEKECAVIINDEVLDTGVLAETITRFLGNPDMLVSMRHNYRAISSLNAADSLINAAVSLK